MGIKPRLIKLIERGPAGSATKLYYSEGLVRY